MSTATPTVRTVQLARREPSVPGASHTSVWVICAAPADEPGDGCGQRSGLDAPVDQGEPVTVGLPVHHRDVLGSGRFVAGDQRVRIGEDVEHRVGRGEQIDVVREASRHRPVAGCSRSR